MIEADVIYTERTGEKPYVHTAALTGGEPRLFAELKGYPVAIRDARPLIGRLSLEREGFELRRVPTAVADLYDDDAVTTTYYAESEAILKEATGASRVVIFDHTRRSDAGATRDGVRGPAARVHNDYTELSGPQRVMDVLGEAEARRLGGAAVAQINLWRPIAGPVRRAPLALLDAASVAPEDLLATDHIYPDRVGEIYHVAHNPEHRWYYFPEMTRDEAILIKGYDSRMDGRARFTPHTAFDLPGTGDDAPPRESIELRALVVFEEG